MIDLGTKPRGEAAATVRRPPKDAITAHRSEAGLDGARLDPLTLLLLVGSALGGVLFTTTYLIEGATRPGYNAWVLPISALSLGAGGWMQQANFVAFGIVTIACSAVGWRRALRNGPGAIAYPILRVIEGLTLIVVGIFSQDAMPGYPAGAVASGPTLHGEIHLLASYVSFSSLAGSLVLAWRLASEPAWRAWAWPAVLVGLMPIVFIAAFGATYGHAPSGLFERLASSGGTPFGLALLGRLLWQARLGRVKASISP